MTVSARNVFKGKVTAMKEGPINAEVEITTAGGDVIVAMLTDTSVKALGLVKGKDAVAIVKAPWVVLMSGSPEFRFSARNQMKGTVDSVNKGAVNSQVKVVLSGGSAVNAVVTNDAVAELGLMPGAPVIAMFKASHVLVGVPA
jgi:molybdate transport system regulatory protein